jgi:hypothetical protein
MGTLGDADSAPCAGRGVGKGLGREGEREEATSTDGQIVECCC